MAQISPSLTLSIKSGLPQSQSQIPQCLSLSLSFSLSLSHQNRLASLPHGRAAIIDFLRRDAIQDFRREPSSSSQ